jgi:hypothetical protein
VIAVILNEPRLVLLSGAKDLSVAMVGKRSFGCGLRMTG